MKTAVYEQPIEVVTDRPARPGAVAHRRKGAGGPMPYPWPACQPLHIHPCDNAARIGNGTTMCEPKCTCKCYCDLPQWHELSALVAVNRGSALCPNTLCFGGQL